LRSGRNIEHRERRLSAICSLWIHRCWRPRHLCASRGLASSKTRTIWPRRLSVGQLRVWVRLPLVRRHFACSSCRSSSLHLTSSLESSRCKPLSQSTRSHCSGDAHRLPWELSATPRAYVIRLGELLSSPVRPSRVVASHSRHSDPRPASPWRRRLRTNTCLDSTSGDPSLNGNHGAVRRSSSAGSNPALSADKAR
jgi:hypothetical protein